MALSDTMRIDGNQILDDPTRRAAARVAFDLEAPVGDAHLDAICNVVAQQCGAPIAVVSLVGETKQQFLGCVGTDLRETPRTTALCATTMMSRDMLVVPDTLKDPRFADFALVKGDPHIRFYAGAPLVTEDGVPLGALCILDTRPREGLEDSQRQLLLLMAATVMDHLSLRRMGRDGRLAAHSAAAALDESELRFRMLIDAMPQMAWSARPDGYSDYFNARWYEFTGQTEGASHGREWEQSLHPDDVSRTTTLWQHSLDSGDPLDIEYRLRRWDGEYRWALTRGLAMRDSDDRIVRWFGTCTDIHDQRSALEEREIVNQELSHRVKNIFAVISGLIGLSARGSPQFAPMADALRERIMALGRAHDFIRWHSRDTAPHDETPNTLRGLLEAIFEPYENYPGDRIHINGNDMAIDDRSATPLALLFHEIVTNAAKYGALSADRGKVELHVDLDGDDVEMVWQEIGGPRVDGVQPAGFGSRLLDLSVCRQLGGRFEHHWFPNGLMMRVRVPARMFSRR